MRNIIAFYFRQRINVYERLEIEKSLKIRITTRYTFVGTWHERAATTTSEQHSFHSIGLSVRKGMQESKDWPHTVATVFVVWPL